MTITHKGELSSSLLQHWGTAGSYNAKSCHDLSYPRLWPSYSIKKPAARSTVLNTHILAWATGKTLKLHKQPTSLKSRHRSVQALGFRAAFLGQAAGPARSSTFHGSAAFASLPRAASKAARRSALTTQAKVMSSALPASTLTSLRQDVFRIPDGHWLTSIAVLSFCFYQDSA